MPANTPSASEGPQRNQTDTCKAIPWCRLAVVLGLYGFQGWALAWAVAITLAWAWAGTLALALAVAVALALAWAVALTGPRAAAVVWAVAVAVVVAWAVAGTWAGAWAGAGAVTGAWAGIKLKAHFSSTQVFWIVWGSASAGLCVGALLGMLALSYQH